MPPYSNIDELTGDCSLGSTDSIVDHVKPVTHSKKSVSFAATATVRLMTKTPVEQRNLVWFTNEEFSAMKKSFQATIKLMTNDGILSEEELETELDMDTLSLHCIRGLEYRTRDGAKNRMKNKLDGVAAVLHEQDRQVYEEDATNAERLAVVYKKANFHCQLAARELGRQDEVDIRQYLSVNNYPKYEQPPVSPSAAPNRLRRTLSLSRKKPPSPSKSEKKRLLGIRRLFSDLRAARRDSVTAAF